MCGIAGRTLSEPGSVGADLTAMMAAQRHRGWDSTGFALYGAPRDDGYVVRALLADRGHLDEDLQALRDVTREHGADFVEEPTWDDSGQRHVLARLVVSDPAPFSAWVDACDELPRVELQSAGRALEIVKDVGDAHEVASKHGVEEFVGTHGLGHVRLATESNVSPVAGHPFWARPFADVAIVHNGQLTNYYTWRRRLQRRGYRFTTENDSELIAVWNSDRMAAGDSLQAVAAAQPRASSTGFSPICWRRPTGSRWPRTAGRSSQWWRWWRPDGECGRHRGAVAAHAVSRGDRGRRTRWSLDRPRLVGQRAGAGGSGGVISAGDHPLCDVDSEIRHSLREADGEIRAGDRALREVNARDPRGRRRRASACASPSPCRVTTWASRCPRGAR